MTTFVHIIGDASVPLWGLSSRERLRRMLHNAGGTTIVEDLASIPAHGTLLVLRGDYVFDARILNALLHTQNIMLEVPGTSDTIIVATQIPSQLKDQACDVLQGSVRPETLPFLQTHTVETITSAYHAELRKFSPPIVLPISKETQIDVERTLFAGAYKGVTDLVTKWLWPRPAQWATRICINLGIQATHVTIASLFLVILAGWLFIEGQYGWGLLAGWLMTFLDTVDGKLARVTVTATRIGHFLDHGIDIIHPPMWYLAWGLGLGTFAQEISWLSLTTVCWWIVGGYVGGRLVEGTFQRCLGAFGIFCWRPFDSYHRLVTARRNPNLILLTAATLMGRPDIGLIAVAGWTIFSTLMLLGRLMLASYTRLNTGPLQAWFATIEEGSPPSSLAIRLFTTQPSTR